MATTVNNERDFGEALKDGEEEIIIEGDLSGKTIKIKATGKIAWVIAIGAVAVAVIAVRSPTSPQVKIAAFAPLVPAAAILGYSVAYSAVLIAVAGGGIEALSRLREYKLTKLPDGRVLLKK